MRLPGPRLMGLRGAVMELFTKLFGDLLVFVYHCFDRIVIHGYLSGLSRPEQVVYFFRQVLGVPVVSKEVLSQRTADYQSLGEGLSPEPATLRPAQAERPCATGARWVPLRLPPHHKRRGGCSPVPLLSQTTVRAPRQQPLPSPPRCSTSTRQPPRGRLPSCRYSNPESRRFACRRLTRRLQVLDSFSQTSFGLESNPPYLSAPEPRWTTGCGARSPRRGRR